MRTLACLIAAGMLGLSASVAGAATAAYGEAFDTLYRIDLSDHTAAEVGHAGSYGGQPIANISGLSYSPDETLYGAAGGMNALARIDAGSGAATIVGSFGLNGEGDPQRNDALDLGMTFGCDGTLWLVSAYAGKLWTVNPANGATTLVGATGHNMTSWSSNHDAHASRQATRSGLANGTGPLRPWAMTGPISARPSRKLAAGRDELMRAPASVVASAARCNRSSTCRSTGQASSSSHDPMR